MEDEIPQDARSRRHHTKSRKGCGICKRRKVKCDERKPTCANCTRYGAECDFPREETSTASPVVSATSNSNGNRESTLRPDSAPRPYQTPVQRDRHTTEEVYDSSASQASGDISSLEMIHLELLHNYTTLTSQTLSGDPLLKNVYRINVPNVAFSNGFVMRSIFALSALHMSLFSANKRQFYLDIARSEHGAALREIASVLSHVTAENCSAVYIAAALIFFYAWAYPRQPGDFFLVSNSGIAEWVFLLQGVRSISENWHTELHNGPFSLTFRLGGRAEQLGDNYLSSAAWLSTIEHSQLLHLRRMVTHAAKDTQTATVYQESIDNLERSFYSISRGPSSTPRSQGSSPSTPRDTLEGSLMPVATSSNVYSWLYKMNYSFIELLNQHDPLALVIFAHFCVLLKYLNSCWWMQGWSTHILQEIWDVLDEEYRLWIRWPIEEIGWSPRG